MRMPPSNGEDDDGREKQTGYTPHRENADTDEPAPALAPIQALPTEARNTGPQRHFRTVDGSGVDRSGDLADYWEHIRKHAAAGYSSSDNSTFAGSTSDEEEDDDDAASYDSPSSAEGSMRRAAPATGATTPHLHQRGGHGDGTHTDSADDDDAASGGSGRGAGGRRREPVSTSGGDTKDSSSGDFPSVGKPGTAARNHSPQSSWGEFVLLHLFGYAGAVAFILAFTYVSDYVDDLLPRRPLGTCVT